MNLGPYLPPCREVILQRTPDLNGRGKTKVYGRKKLLEEPLQLKNMKNPTKEGAGNLSLPFGKDTMANELIRRCSGLQLLGNVHIKTGTR